MCDVFMWGRNLSGWNTFRCSTLEWAPGLTHKYLNRLEGPAKDKNFQPITSNRKLQLQKIYNIGPRVYVFETVMVHLHVRFQGQILQ